MQTLDDTDRRLLRLMQDDPVRPKTELAREAGLSVGAVWRRIERLEATGVSLGTEVVVDPKAAGFEVQVFLRVTLDKTAPGAFDAFLRAAWNVRHVTAVQTLLGRVDVRLDVVARDLVHYREIYRTEILALPHIADVEALMLVSELKSSGRVPV
ncbi:MAG: Lrp/AsnC family transcriptional regulator [Pseudomonadota bacterium]